MGFGLAVVGGLVAVRKGTAAPPEGAPNPPAQAELAQARAVVIAIPEADDEPGHALGHAVLGPGGVIYTPRAKRES